MENHNDTAALFSETTPLLDPGRNRRGQYVNPDGHGSRFVRVAATHPVTVAPARSAAQIKAADELQRTLRLLARNGLDVVCPVALVAGYAIEGVDLEPIDDAVVLGGSELVLGPDLAKVGASERAGEPGRHYGARCLDLYSLAIDGLREDGRGIRRRRINGEWRLAWKTEKARGKTVVVEVALRVALRDCVVAARGSYRIGGRESRAGDTGFPNVNAFLVGVEPHGSPERPVFWLHGEGLSKAIEAVHARVAMEAIRAQGCGFEQH